MDLKVSLKFNEYFPVSKAVVDLMDANDSALLKKYPDSHFICGKCNQRYPLIPGLRLHHFPYMRCDGSAVPVVEIKPVLVEDRSVASPDPGGLY